MKIIIAGSRHYTNRAQMEMTLDRLLPEMGATEILTGGARGADTLAADYAKRKGYRLTTYPADWLGQGRGAGPRRNRLMAERADGLIAYWNERAGGTASMIKEARRRGLPTRIVTHKNQKP